MMKPGDLVSIINYGEPYSTEAPQIGLLIRVLDTTNQPYVVLIDGTLRRYNIWHIRCTSESHEAR